MFRWLRLGGAGLSVSRQALLESSFSLPGLAPYALSAETLAVGHLDHRVPLIGAGGHLGAWAVRALDLELGADIATWAPQTDDLPPYVGDLRVAVALDVNRAETPLTMRVMSSVPTRMPVSPRAYFLLGTR